MIDKGIDYIENELPEFTLSEEGNIKFALTLNIGTADDNIKAYKLIPLITRKRNYRWRRQ